MKETTDPKSTTKAKSPAVKVKARAKASKSTKATKPSFPKTEKKAVLPWAVDKVVKKIEPKKVGGVFCWRIVSERAYTQVTGKKTAKKQLSSVDRTDTIEGDQGDSGGNNNPPEKAVRMSGGNDNPGER